jgi:nitrite reductase (NADH) large subunit
LARQCGLEIGELGGVVVDGQCRTSDRSIFAIGECASAAGRVYGLVSPGYQMARVVADTLSGHKAAFTGADLSTKLKLLGVEVASFGDAHATTAGSATISYTDHPGRVHKRLVIGGDGQLLGGVLVGDTAGYEPLVQMARGEVPTPERPAALIVPVGDGPVGTIGIDALPDAATVCSCENVTKGAICSTVTALIADTGQAGLAAVKKACRAGTGCGACVPQLIDLVRVELARAGVAVTDHLCEHFPYSRRELFDIVRVENITTFSALVAAHGTGRGCEITAHVRAPAPCPTGGRSL